MMTILDMLRACGDGISSEAADTIQRLQAENSMLRVLLRAMAERVAAQSEVLSRRAERTGEGKP